MDEQNDFIQEYFDSIGNFDNRYLISNIAFLAKKIACASEKLKICLV